MKKQQKPTMEETSMVPSEADDQQRPTNTEMLEGFDIKSFFVSGNEAPIVQEQADIPVRKPQRQQWFQAHPTIEKDAYLLDLKEENNYYLIHPSVIKFVPTKIQLSRLYLCMLHSGGLFFYPVGLQDSQGKWNSYHRAAFQAIPKAREHWIRLEADKPNSTYNVYIAEGLAEPSWPDITIDKAITMAFKDRVITTKDHPLLRQFAGKFNEKME